MSIHILGIRHHGVGSAKNLLEELKRIKPDIVLIEAPEEITEAFRYIGHKELVPPVAVMAYDANNLNNCVFYPFAAYSPEWVAMNYAHEKNIPFRAMDLPAAVSFANKEKEDNESNEPKVESIETVQHWRDPMDYIAEVAGFPSGEAWWEFHFEQKKDNAQEHFEAVIHVMQALRMEGIKSSLEEENIAREAYMRQLIRKTQNEMYNNIAVICGAWHAPALQNLDGTAKNDAKILKAVKAKTKITVSWIPWTNARLSTFTGYGAGIYSPGWYEHLWNSETNTEIAWLTRVAKLLRKKGMDISTAHIIEAYTLSRSLSSLRNKYYISLQELNEAALSVMCMGDSILLELIKNELIIGHSIGTTPPDIPKVPLQSDFEENLKKLRLVLSGTQKEQVLDLRKDLDLQRSIFFNRLRLLSISWATQIGVRSKGTFKESWLLEWQPEMMIKLIDIAYLGNTVTSAAHALIVHKCTELNSIAEATSLIHICIAAELFEGVEILLNKILDLSVVSTDILDLMQALPNLIEVSRYGNVRKSDWEMLKTIVEQLLTKVFIGLSNACYGLDEANSIAMFELIAQLNVSIAVFNETSFSEQWYQTLHLLLDKDNIHPIILGCTCRLLLDGQQLSAEETNVRISFALSIAGDPHIVAFWLEGFLKGSGIILLYDNKLWNLLYQWVEAIPAKTFIELLPLLRRTFSKFEFGERRKIGEKAKEGLVTNEQNNYGHGTSDYDFERAKEILPIIKSLAGF
ncbi:MAG: DUF5682 family protein [Chitinophagales bacterium]|nr:hypothetical protein [Bacteroidota bacterium]MCB9043449.1 hypothetical protein [Chitinophagales bacterium]